MLLPAGDDAFTLTIGRWYRVSCWRLSPVQFQIRVDDPFASSAHARIFERGDFMYVEDMGSTNGISVDGRKVSRTALGDGSRVQIGHTSLVVRLLEEEPDV